MIEKDVKVHHVYISREDECLFVDLGVAYRLSMIHEYRCIKI